MKSILLGVSLFAAAATSAARANSIDPKTVKLPWVNAETPNSFYEFKNFPNRVHVLEAFANFCPPCNQNAAIVDAMVEEYKEKALTDAKYERVQFIDLALDTRMSEIRTWINNHKPNHPVAQDAGQKVWRALMQENSIPQVFVTDCAGHMVYTNTDVWTSNTQRAIRQAIETALQTECE